MQTEDYPNNILIRGVVGSTAYGLNHEGSDTDWLGLYAVDAEKLLGIDLPDLEKAKEYKNPDTKYYEVLHYVRLALKSNPSILELMWLNDYDLLTPAGQALIDIRDAFPTQKLVRAAYLGYANQQYDKLLKDKREEKRAKNARHFIRLLRQGSEFYKTGHLTVKLPNPEEIRDLGSLIAKGNLDIAKQEMELAETLFDTNSALRAEVDRDVVNQWLLGVRYELY